MSKLDIAKLAARTIVGISTSFTVKQVIANNLNEPESSFEAFKMGCGCVMVGALVAEQARDYIDDVFDSGVRVYNEVKDRQAAKATVQS